MSDSQISENNFSDPMIIMVDISSDYDGSGSSSESEGNLSNTASNF